MLVSHKGLNIFCSPSYPLSKMGSSVSVMPCDKDMARFHKFSAPIEFFGTHGLLKSENGVS